ncbi:MAG: CdaR family protein [Caldisericia bacterium]|nr:CdaR family protein [Caldisericia bacterium]
MDRNKITIFLISFLLAFGFWLYVSLGEGPESERVFLVQLTYRNMPQDLTILEGFEKVEIKIVGSKQRISTLRENNIIAYVDLSNLSEGAHNLPINVEIPSFFKIAEIYPSRVNIYLDRVITIEKNIRVDFIGTLKPGLIIDEPEVSPKTIKITGPSKKIDNIRDVSVTIDLSTINSDVTLTIIPKIKDGLGNEIPNLSINPSILKVNIKVKTILSSKVVPIVPKFVGEISGDYGIVRVSIKPSIMTILGKVEVLNKIESLTTEDINITNLKESKIFTTKVVVPEDLELKEENLITIQIIVERKVSKTINNIKIDLLNKNDNFEYIMDPQIIKIEIYGFESIIKDLTPSDFVASISVLNLEDGIYELKVEVISTKENVNILKINPEKVKLIIKKKEG